MGEVPVLGKHKVCELNKPLAINWRYIRSSPSIRKAAPLLHGRTCRAEGPGDPPHELEEELAGLPESPTPKHMNYIPNGLPLIYKSWFCPDSGLIINDHPALYNDNKQSS